MEYKVSDLYPYCLNGDGESELEVLGDALYAIVELQFPKYGNVSNITYQSVMYNKVNSALRDGRVRVNGVVCRDFEFTVSALDKVELI